MNKKNVVNSLACFVLFMSLSAFAQNEEIYIKPLQIEPDINSVDLLSGKYYPELPQLSIPAAPRLTFSSLQQFDIKITGTLYHDINGVDLRKESYSLTYGTKDSEYFNCVDFECTGSVNSGSRLLGNMNTQHFVYTQGKTGIKIVYDLPSSLFINTDPYRTVTKTGTWYASKIIFPDGESLDIRYETAIAGVVTYYRPVTIMSNIGFQLNVSYHSNDISTGASGWSKVASATIVQSSAANVALAKLTYSNTTPTQVSDLIGRTWHITGFNNALGASDFTTAYSVKLPSDSINAVATSAASRNYGGVTHNHFVTQVIKQGQTFNYTYTAKSGTGYSPQKQFSAVSITGPEGYRRTVNLQVFPSPSQHQQISSSIDANGHQTFYHYTSGNLLDTVTFSEGNKVKFSYDHYGNIIEKRAIAKPSSGLPDLVTTAYYPVDHCGGLSCYRPDYVIDPNGNRTDYTFDSTHGGMLTKAEPMGDSGTRRITTNTYQQINGLYRLVETAICGANQCGTDEELVTQYTYWNDTHLPLTVTKTNGVGSSRQVTTYTYDNAGRVITEDGPLPGTNDATYARYDTVGRKTWDIGPVNQQSHRVTTRTTYRLQDDQVVKLEQGSLTSTVSTILAVSRVTQNVFNSYGLLTQIQEGTASTTEKLKQFSYDGRNRISCETVRMDPAVYSYLSLSACTLATAGSYGKDRIIKHTYDSLSRIVMTESGYGTTDSGVDIELGYTANGQVDWRKDGNGNLTNYAYDGFDRLETTHFPDGTYEQNGYDDNGNLTTWRKRDGNVLSHDYDAINLRTRTTVPGELTIAIDYDGLGRERSITRGASSVSYTYDALGRRYTSTTHGKTLTYHYDGAGRRSQLTYPDGFYVNYAYDNTGALTSIKENNAAVLSGFVYDTLGRLTRQQRHNGISTSFGYDNVWRLDTFDHSGVNKASFAYNPSNQLISRVVSHEAFQIKLPSSGEAFYDVNELNQYTSVKGSALSYDLNGNLKTYDGWTYDYNAHNRLVTAVKTGTTLSLTYDAIGRLASSTLNGVQTTFLYDDNELVAEYSSTGALLRRYVHGLKEDDPLVWYEGTGTTNTRYLLPDEKGSIIAETNGSGSMLTLHRYGPFGEPQNSSASRFRYTGQILLPGTELYYYKARVYHPKLGRFMQTDPIGYEDGMNWYVYVGNDPVNATDPTGKYGRGSGWKDEEWKKFDEAQKGVADAMSKTSSGLKSMASNMKDGEVTKDGYSASDLTKMAGSLDAGVKALQDNGKGGYLANAKSIEGNVAGYGEVGGKIITMNVGHPNFGNNQSTKFSIGHESLHNAGLDHSKLNPPYRYGSVGQRQAYEYLPKEYQSSNPDHVMSQVYP